MSKFLVQVNIRPKGQTLCWKHNKEELTFVCYDCEEILVCNKCISTEHRRHDVVAINILVEDVFPKLQDQNKEITEKRVPKIKSNVEDVGFKVKRIQNELEIHTQNAVDRGEYLKCLIDTSTSQIVCELREHATKIITQFDDFCLKSNRLLRKLENIVQENHETTKSSNNVLIVDVEKKNRLSSLNLKEPIFGLKYTHPRFVEGTDQDNHLKSALGLIQYQQEGADWLSHTIAISEVFLFQKNLTS